MNNAQIYAVVNAAASQAFGASAVAAIDTGSFVSLGGQVLSSATSIDSFYHSLVDRIYKTIVVNRPYEARKRNMRVNSTTFGAILQKISFTPGQAVANQTYEAIQADPYAVTPSMTVTQNLFSDRGSFSHEDVIPDPQIYSAFTSESAMAAFISGIYTAINNLIQHEIESMDNAAVNTMMANVYTNGTTSMKRNLLTEYNTISGASLTTANCLSTPAFLRYCNKEIMQVAKFMRGLKTIYNVGGAQRHTPEGDLVVETLTEFGIASQYYMESDTYHNDLANIGVRHQDINEWQGDGTANDFSERSKIMVQNKDIDPLNPTTTYTLTGVIANIRDVEAVGTMFDRLRVNSKYNERAERLNVYWKADKGYYVDPNENAAIFYVA